MVLFQIAEETRIGFVALRVSELAPMIEFYTKKLGLSLLKKTDETAYLGLQVNQQVLMTLRVSSKDKPTQGSIGMSNFAFVLPSKRLLGRLLRQLVDGAVEISGCYQNEESFFFTIEDPEENGLLLVYDNTMDQWQNLPIYDRSDPKTVEIAKDKLMATTPHALIGIPAGTAIGYIEMIVPDINKAVDFYEDKLGFHDISEKNKSAQLISGGNHHNLGIKLIEQKQGTNGHLGMDYLDIVVPDISDLDQLEENLKSSNANDFEVNQNPRFIQITDPAGNRIWFTKA